MAQKRRWLLDSEKEEIWRRWKTGAPLRAIGRALNRRSAVIRKVVVAAEALPPVHADAPRERSAALSAKRFRGGLQRVCRCGRLQQR